MALRIQVTSPTRQDSFEHPDGPLEFGRGPQREAPRFVIDDRSFSRDQIRIEELSVGRIRVANLSATQPIETPDGGSVATGEWRDLVLPVLLTVCRTEISVAPAARETAPSVMARPAEAEAETELALVTLGPQAGAARRRDSPAGAAHSAETIERLTDWLHTIVELQQAAPGSPEFFRQTARAMLDLIGMDLGMVLLAGERGWSVAGTAGARSDAEARYSRTMVDYVARNRQTVYQDVERMAGTAMSLLRIEAAVAAPVFGLNGELAGVLYGARNRGLFARGPVGPLEAQLVQLLAAAAGANLARSAALRTRIQFEQFFSPELVRELEQHPDLLEGRSQEVTLVFTDLRGFTALSERLGPEKTCRMVRDMMEELSDKIVAEGGAIVDYAGDGILAMWNAPTQQPDHALRACRAALGMFGALPRINQRWGQIAGDALSLGIGINSGPAQVGNTGSSRKVKYGPHGHTVNVASRVQDATKLLGLPLLVTQAVRDRLPPGMHTRRLGQVRLPGVERPAVMYELQGEHPTEKWLRLRDTYEKGLALYEAGEWAGACQAVAPLLPAAGDGERYDIPTLKLLRRAWECLEARPDPFVPIIDVCTK
jgi:adenylate cyclase